MNSIKGSGQLSTRETQVSSFIHLHFSINGTKEVPVSIELIHSDEEKIIIETDENLINYFTATNLGQTLFITSEAGLRFIDFSSLTIKIFLRQLAKVNICSENYQLKSNVIATSSPLTLKIQGTGKSMLNLDVPVIKAIFQNEGDIILQGKCEEADIKSQSVGNLLAKELIAQTMKIKNMSDGSVEVYSEKSISITHYGDGNVFYYGEGKLVAVNHRGDGIIQHVKKQDTFVDIV